MQAFKLGLVCCAPSLLRSGSAHPEGCQNGQPSEGATTSLLSLPVQSNSSHVMRVASAHDVASHLPRECLQASLSQHLVRKPLNQQLFEPFVILALLQVSTSLAHRGISQKVLEPGTVVR